MILRIPPRTPMNRPLSFAFLLAALIAAAIPAQLAPESKPAAGKKLNKPDAARLVAALSGPEDAAKRARATLIETRAEDRKLIAAAIREAPFRAPKGFKAKPTSTEKLPLKGAEVPEGEFIVRLPSKYDEKTAWPMVFRLHGSGDVGSNFRRGWDGSLMCARCISIIPTIPTKERMGWNEKGVRAFLDAIYRFMLAHYNVDTDKVYVDGYSAGGGAATMIPQAWPHRIAAFYSRARVGYTNQAPDARQHCLAILRHIPGFFVMGADDTAERVEGFKFAEEYYKTNKLNGVFHLVKGVGHDYVQDLDKPGHEFLLKQSRTAHPKEFDAAFCRFSNALDEVPLMSRAYWLEAKDVNGGMAPATASAKDNVIEIKSTFLTSGAVVLNDEIVDLDKPVTVKLNGEEVFSGAVERSVDFLLKWADTHRDRRWLYWNEIPFGPGSRR
jgi:dienelactone hydrolase